MDRRSRTRRDVLTAGAAIIGTMAAGCTAPGTNSRSPRAAELSFEGADREFRDRTRVVYDRVSDLVESTIRQETTVTLIDEAEMRDRVVAGSVVGETTTQRLAHRALGLVETLEPDLPFEFAGAYYPGSRTIVLVGAGEDEIDDQLLAHELFHAIQFQTAGITGWERGWSIGFDRYAAQQAIIEGTAMLVEDEYVGGCGGNFSSCQLDQPGQIFPQEIEPALLLSYGAYFNGHDFAESIAERSGWSGVWDTHDDPPISTGQILRPEWYPDRRPERVPTPARPEDPWTRLDSERLGMQALFLTLWNADVLPDSAALTDGERGSDVFSSFVRYRSAPTDRWRGDAFTAFERSDGRYGWVWRIRWANTAAAEAGFELFYEWADARGSPTDVDALWEREDRYETIALNDEDVIVAMAPDVQDLDVIAPNSRA